MLSCFSRVRYFPTPRTAALQAPLSMGILQARILEWAAMPSCGGLFPTPQRRNPRLLISLLHWLAASLPLAPTGKPLRASPHNLTWLVFMELHQQSGVPNLVNMSDSSPPTQVLLKKRDSSLAPPAPGR